MDYEKMDSESLDRIVLDRIAELEQKELVDHHFRQCYTLKEDNGAQFFVELIALFLEDVRQIIKAMAQTLDGPVLNLEQMHGHCIKLKGSSACFGARRIRNECSSLGHAIENKSKDGCLRALNRIKYEIKALEDQLDIIIKIEKEIVSRASRQRRYVHCNRKS